MLVPDSSLWLERQVNFFCLLAKDSFDLVKDTV